MKVTFDSNVWEKVVLGKEGFFEIRDKIYSGDIEPFICEIAISLESIKKKNRLSFWETYQFNTEIVWEKFKEKTYHRTICFSPDNKAHPGLHPKLKDCLSKANSLGFKVLPMTNILTVRSPEIPDEMRIIFSHINEFWKYADELCVCNNYIKSIGAGIAQYDKFKDNYGVNIYSVRKAIRELPYNIEKKFYESIAEWVDGDSLSAHYAYKNDYFCTLDLGKNAGSKSVFFPENLKKIMSGFCIQVISPSELALL